MTVITLQKSNEITIKFEREKKEKKKSNVKPLCFGCELRLLKVNTTHTFMCMINMPKL
jgi:hypothetical protein